MPINLESVGKKYNREWIFRNMNHVFSENEPCVVLGANGSGKSTLLQVLSGAMRPSQGKINYEINGKKTDSESIFRAVTIAAPYLELLEELTLEELIAFQEKFKPWRNNRRGNEIINLTGLEKVKNKTLRQFSSGMKQRVRLSLAILADSPLLLLDEPCSNLDAAGIEWYQQLIKENVSQRLVLVCSNQQEYEYRFCTQELRIEDYKK